MIKYSEKDGIGLIMLNRPEKRNALHPAMIKEIKEQLNLVEVDDKVKVLIISGEGSSFCAGADLAYLQQLENYSAVENEKDSESLAELFLKFYYFPKPIIAAVNGPAIAGGCGIVSVCDFIVADSAKAKFGYSEVKIGFVPAIVSAFLMKKIGEGKTRQLLLSGEIIDTQKAHEIGLVNIITDNVLEESFILAGKLCNNSLSSLQMTKKMISAIASLNVNEAVNFSVELNTISRSNSDFKEGLNNFLNKK
jgi:methylglutaconyl-CoA hydratase